MSKEIDPETLKQFHEFASQTAPIIRALTEEFASIAASKPEYRDVTVIKAAAVAFFLHTHLADDTGKEGFKTLLQFVWQQYLKGSGQDERG
jgi:hypothetical protein